MDFNTYQIQTRRTCPVFSNNKINLSHMDMGIFTEWGEMVDIFKRKLAYNKNIDFINLKEEIGDICWYATNKYYFLTGEKITVNTSWLNTTEQRYSNSDESSFVEFTELITTKNIDFFNPLLIIRRLLFVCEYFEIDFEDCLDKNIAKLYARYPEKFDENFAINRNLDKERKILEQ